MGSAQQPCGSAARPRIAFEPGFQCVRIQKTNPEMWTGASGLTTVKKSRNHLAENREDRFTLSEAGASRGSASAGSRAHHTTFCRSGSNVRPGCFQVSSGRIRWVWNESTFRGGAFESNPGRAASSRTGQNGFARKNSETYDRSQSRRRKSLIHNTRFRVKWGRRAKPWIFCGGNQNGTRKNQSLVTRRIPGR